MPKRSNAVIAEILRQGANKPRKHVLAALTTGRVESNFRNLPGGDADSQGWRQERSSLYKDPQNLKASVKRFYREAAQHDRGQGVGDLAADVQRPAAQYRGRYAEHLDEAKKILGGGAVGGGGGGKTTTSITRNPVTPAVNVAAILAQRETEQAQRPVTGPSLPESLTPTGYSPVVASTPSPAEAPATDLKAAIDKIAQDKLDGVTVKTKTTKTGGGGGGGGGTPAKGSEIKELIWAGPGSQFIDNGKFVAPYAADQHRDHVHVAAGPKTTDRLGRLAQSMGLNVGENPDFGGVDPVHTGGSFHYRDMAIDVSGDPAKMRRFAKRVAKYQKRRR